MFSSSVPPTRTSRETVAGKHLPWWIVCLPPLWGLWKNLAVGPHVSPGPSSFSTHLVINCPTQPRVPCVKVECQRSSTLPQNALEPSTFQRVLAWLNQTHNSLYVWVWCWNCSRFTLLYRQLYNQSERLLPSDWLFVCPVACRCGFVLVLCAAPRNETPAQRTNPV